MKIEDIIEIKIRIKIRRKGFDIMYLKKEKWLYRNMGLVFISFSENNYLGNCYVVFNECLII